MRFSYYIIASVLIFYFVSSFAMTLPYAPWSKLDAFMNYVAPSIGSVFFILIFIFYKNKSEKKTLWVMLVRNADSWRATLKGIFMIVICPPAFLFMLAFSVHRWPAYPTYVFANQTIDTYLYCVEKKNYAKESRGLVVMKLKYSDEEYLKLPWPKGEAPRCPGFVHVRGKKGLFGIYFTDVK